MFLVNSRFSLVSATPTRSHREGRSRVRAPLLPKLRGHFAEFLNHSSLVRLGILYLTTCVGLGYGPWVSSLEAFLGSIGSPNSPHPAMHHLSEYMNDGFAYRSSYRFAPVLPLTGTATFLRHPIAYLLPERVPRSRRAPHPPKGDWLHTIWVVSRSVSVRDGHTRVREYQPVVHRLRLSASP